MTAATRPRGRASAPPARRPPAPTQVHPRHHGPRAQLTCPGRLVSLLSRFVPGSRHRAGGGTTPSMQAPTWRAHPPRSLTRLRPRPPSGTGGRTSSRLREGKPSCPTNRSRGRTAPCCTRRTARTRRPLGPRSQGLHATRTELPGARWGHAQGPEGASPGKGPGSLGARRWLAPSLLVQSLSERHASFGGTLPVHFRPHFFSAAGRNSARSQCTHADWKATLSHEMHCDHFLSAWTTHDDALARVQSASTLHCGLGTLHLRPHAFSAGWRSRSSPAANTHARSMIATTHPARQWTAQL